MMERSQAKAHFDPRTEAGRKAIEQYIDTRVAYETEPDTERGDWEFQRYVDKGRPAFVPVAEDSMAQVHPIGGTPVIHETMTAAAIMAARAERVDVA